MFQEDEDRETGILGRPLSPEVLRKIGVLKDFPPALAGFRADADWTLRYRILGCHGYADSGNETWGALTLERRSGDPFRLRVRQRIVHTNGQETLDIEMTCRKDPIASPVSWSVANRRFDGEGAELADLRLSPSGTNSKPSLTSDFSLMEAVQRLPFGPPNLPPFDVLEGMAILRPAHRLYFDGDRRFHHTGPGLLPYQYWLDENHRLLLVVSQWRAYILDDAAESLLERTRTGSGRKRKKQ